MGAVVRRPVDAPSLVQGVLAGDRLRLARAISHVENEGAAAHAILSGVFPHTGRARIIGVTGAPGTGKSTLVTALAQSYRAADLTVAVVAIDPSSPFTGGALLGDRVRMAALSGDSGVFIRSMATRGSLGGLSKTTGDVVTLLDAAGFDRILVETVGVGQAEVEIASTAHTTLVVEAPGMGDEVQAIKAGILEIGDVLVVNKADRAGADRTVQALEMMLEIESSSTRLIRHHSQILRVESRRTQDGNEEEQWQVTVMKTVAAAGTGIEELRARNIKVRYRRSSILQGIELIRRAIKSGDGRSKLIISPRCSKLIEALRCYHYPESATPDELPLKDGIYDHPIDALRYFFINHNHSGPTITRSY